MDEFSSNLMISEMKRNNFIKIKTFAVWGSMWNTYFPIAEEFERGARIYCFSISLA